MMYGVRHIGGSVRDTVVWSPAYAPSCFCPGPGGLGSEIYVLRPWTISNLPSGMPSWMSGRSAERRGAEVEVEASQEASAVWMTCAWIDFMCSVCGIGTPGQRVGLVGNTVGSVDVWGWNGRRRRSRGRRTASDAARLDLGLFTRHGVVSLQRQDDRVQE
jgi:hypothetical protein